MRRNARAANHGEYPLWPWISLAMLGLMVALIVKMQEETRLSESTVLSDTHNRKSLEILELAKKLEQNTIYGSGNRPQARKTP